jgi:hypothetical protein
VCRQIHLIRNLHCTGQACESQIMQLRIARLCLNCDEIHDTQQCPVCASETFAYISKWVPTPDRRAAQRRPVPTPSVALPRPRTVIGIGVVGIGVMGLARWFAKGKKRLEDSAMKNVGDLR